MRVDAASSHSNDDVKGAYNYNIRSKLLNIDKLQFYKCRIFYYVVRWLLVVSKLLVAILKCKTTSEIIHFEVISELENTNKYLII